MIAGAAVQQAADGGMGSSFTWRRTTQGLEQRVEPGRGLAPRRKMVIGKHRIRRLLSQPGEGRDLIGQHLQRQPRILFGVIHMPDLQPPVLIVLDQMVVRIARKGQGVQPQRINRGCAQRRKPRPVGHQMRQIVPQDIVSHHIRHSVAQRLQPVQREVQGRAFVNQCLFSPYRRKGKKPCRLRIDLQINRDAVRQERGGFRGQTSASGAKLCINRLITLLLMDARKGFGRNCTVRRPPATVPGTRWPRL